MLGSWLARGALASSLVGILGGGPLIQSDRPASAAQIVPAHPISLAGSGVRPLNRSHDDDDGHGCSILVYQCLYSPTVCQPIVVVKKVYVPVQVIRYVKVYVPVVQKVYVQVPYAVAPTATPIPPTTGTTKVTVKVSVPGQAPAPTATPDTTVIGNPGDPMF
jgi:hypothetical protein